MGGRARVHRLADVRAGVGQPEQHQRVDEHLGDRVDLLVEERPGEQERAVGRER